MMSVVNALVIKTMQGLAEVQEITSWLVRGGKVEKETKKSGKKIDGDKKIGKDGVSPGWGKFRERWGGQRDVEAKNGGKKAKACQNPCQNPFSRQIQWTFALKRMDSQ
jgi:hypothetical protein